MYQRDARKRWNDACSHTVPKLALAKIHRNICAPVLFTLMERMSIRARRQKAKPTNAEEDEHDETRTLHSRPCGWYFIHHCGCSRAGWGCGSRRARCRICNALPGTGLRMGSRLLFRCLLGAGTMGVSRLLSPVLCASLLSCALLSSLLWPPLTATGSGCSHGFRSQLHICKNKSIALDHFSTFNCNRLAEHRARVGAGVKLAVLSALIYLW